MSSSITEYNLILARIRGDKVLKLWILTTDNKNSICRKILIVTYFFVPAQAKIVPSLSLALSEY